MKKIAMGMSGGVDSSLSASLLKSAGYDVTGVFLECWRAPGCRAEEDRKDALAIALQLGIPFEVLDFKDAYKEKVVEYFFREYKHGTTPNPDVMCNKEIKFGLFYDWAMKNGFDGVATGHYAQIEKRDIVKEFGGSEQSRCCLIQSVDTWKDQTYFLYLLKEEQLDHVIFPIGHLSKKEVRLQAKALHLGVSDKPDSQGICFIGEINVHDFLKERLGENPGEVVDTKGNVIGEHKGLWFYTIGQRHGFTLKGKIRTENNEWKHVVPPFYVIAKDVKNNQLVVGFGEETYTDSFSVSRMHWINPVTDTVFQEEKDIRVDVRIRHTGKLHVCTVTKKKENYVVTLTEKIQGIAEGQSAVFYKNGICLGGGAIIVSNTV